MKPRLLDVFCGAGGSARGYQLAGFHVTGIDVNPQPRYAGDEFIQADALDYLAAHGHEYDAIHASPPCQDHSPLSNVVGKHGSGWLLAATRAALSKIEKPYVIENVPGARMPGSITLCGSELGLSTHHDGRRIWLKRHRQFESNVLLMGAGGCNCHGRHIIGVYGHGDGGGRGRRKGWKDTFALRKEVMGIDWMTRAELSQAIPPAMTQFVGEWLIAHLDLVPAKAHDKEQQ